MPYLALVVSGGHTALFVVEDFGRYRKLGATRDDAAGEAFDKVAKLMGLGYPGGQVIDELARQGNPQGVRLPRARVKGAPLDFSFSGVKTAVALCSSARRARCRRPRRDLAASFQEAVVEMLVAADDGGGARSSTPRRSRSPAGSRRTRACGTGWPRGRRGGGPPPGRAVIQVLHRQCGDDRDGGELPAAARRARSAHDRCRSQPSPVRSAIAVSAADCGRAIGARRSAGGAGRASRAARISWSRRASRNGSSQRRARARRRS